MKVGKWRVEFKTTITRDYKDVKEVPFWRLYIVRREPVLITDPDTGELLDIYNKMVIYHRFIVAITYDEVLEQVKNLCELCIAGNVLCEPSRGFYIVAYPRRTNKMRV